jgi:hypothetical protein
VPAEHVSDGLPAEGGEADFEQPGTLTRLFVGDRSRPARPLGADWLDYWVNPCE